MVGAQPGIYAILGLPVGRLGGLLANFVVIDSVHDAAGKFGPILPRLAVFVLQPLVRAWASAWRRLGTDYRYKLYVEMTVDMDQAGRGGLISTTRGTTGRPCRVIDGIYAFLCPVVVLANYKVERF